MTWFLGSYYQNTKIFNQNASVTDRNSIVLLTTVIRLSPVEFSKFDRL